ncbi:uncharacterized protein T551_00945 [Pneumocystis jirovecii RU7]|uniref:Phospholipid/glycerol acyltransferase domain-containing protein n=1 Tax=Pneumocystis jirovecii (strain RU7) TaxID=1408657 RepID=A0A0W4ZTL2_PNEJ7|nr:uncharacterized protein T551_00945 [Pneumocystis jirovecii RU7]KTW31684.1 hypothetical protein T551_00945 [Pneumocystis jirovecii RU7]
MDVIILAAVFPKPVHFWAKNSIFKMNSVVAKILYNMGVIPVDRETKNNNTLFKITFNALKNLETLAIYPEGTSHTSPHLLDLKDGVSWVALQYKYNIFDHNIQLQKKPNKLNNLILLPVGITYLEKFKYRSNVIVTYGSPINICLYEDNFLEDPKNNVKKLTNLIKERLYEITINATNWNVLKVSELSRSILFSENKNMNLKNHILITQSLINIFESRQLNIENQDTSDLYNILENELKALASMHIEVNDIINLYKVSRKYILFEIIRKTVSLVIHSLFVLPVIIIYIPIYAICSFVEKKQTFNESKAQDKALTAFFVSIIVNICLFFLIQKIIIFYPLNEVISICVVIIIVNYYNKVIDGFYDKWKCYKKAWYIGWFIFKPYGKSYIAQRLYQLQNAKKKLLNIIRSGQGKDTNTIKDAFEMTPMKHFYMK